MIEIDESKHPIIIINYLGDKPFGDAEYKDHLLKTVEIMKNSNVPVAIICDPSQSTIRPSSVQRAMTTEVIQEYEEVYKNKCACFCTIIKSVIFRGVITALQWLLPKETPMEFQTFSSFAEGLLWSKKKLKEFTPRG